jgi:hypothetical protein
MKIRKSSRYLLSNRTGGLMATRRTAVKKSRERKPGKIDLYAEHSSEYVTPKSPVIIETRKAHYLAIEGEGSPKDAAFTNAIGALYNVAFTIKMARKFAATDYKVTSLEGLWWTTRDGDFMDVPEKDWRWRLMIRIPDFITAAELKESVAKLLDRGKSDLVKQVKRLSLNEGKCVQVLHTGPYDAEGPTISAMKSHAAANGLRFRGLHHEIYLSDPRRVASARLRTVLRHPVGK